MKVFLSVFLTVCLVFCVISQIDIGHVFSRNKTNGDEDIAVVRALKDCKNTTLSTRLEAAINQNPKWKALVTEKRLAVGLVDLRDPAHPALATVNGNHMMYAASLPKIAILLAAEDAIYRGELDESDEIKTDLRLMISKSDNAASTRMIDRMGYDKIEQVLRNERYQLYKNSEGGGLWVGKRYAAQGLRHPDPLKGLSHAATAMQVCRFYYLMYNGKLVSPERSENMMEIMRDPELHHKFVNTLERIAPDAVMYRKSGSWQNYHADSILVDQGDNRRYILVALAEDGEGEQIMRQLVTVIEGVLRIGA